jgi:hypothetical protein
VDSAVEDAEKNGSLNLKKAIDATVALQTQGKNVAELKRRIETVRSQLSEADRQGNAKKHAVRLADEFKNLRKARDDLRLALLTAERLEVPNARGKVDELRKKITEAEAPFEAVTR